LIIWLVGGFSKNFQTDAVAKIRCATTHSIDANGGMSRLSSVFRLGVVQSTYRVAHEVDGEWDRLLVDIEGARVVAGRVVGPDDRACRGPARGLDRAHRVRVVVAGAERLAFLRGVDAVSRSGSSVNRLDEVGVAILIQRENPALLVSDECSDAQSESRSEQGGSESRKLR